MSLQGGCLRVRRCPRNERFECRLPCSTLPGTQMAGALDLYHALRFARGGVEASCLGERNAEALAEYGSHPAIKGRMRCRRAPMLAPPLTSFARPRRPRTLLFRDLSDQRGRNLARVISQALHELDVPVVMKVSWMHSFACDELLVPTGIVVVGCVKRLVQVADEVEKELQRQELLGSTGGRIARSAAN